MVQEQTQIINNALKIIAEKGCNANVLQEASILAGTHESLAEALFPGGVEQLLKTYIAEVNCELLSIYQARHLNQELKTQERIQKGIEIQLEILSPNRKAIARVLSYCSLPWNYSFALGLLWKNLDFIWYNLGNDKASDFNYYTKRALLAKVYLQTINFWLKDNSPDFKDTKEFLKNRLASTTKVGESIGGALKDLLKRANF